MAPVSLDEHLLYATRYAGHSVSFSSLRKICDVSSLYLSLFTDEKTDV
jgi:hypothetical protein